MSSFLVFFQQTHQILPILRLLLGCRLCRCQRFMSAYWSGSILNGEKHMGRNSSGKSDGRVQWPIVIKIKREIKSNVFPFQLKSNLRNWWTILPILFVIWARLRRHGQERHLRKQHSLYELYLFSYHCKYWVAKRTFESLIKVPPQITSSK
jgi:hypothetical protein